MIIDQPLAFQATLRASQKAHCEVCMTRMHRLMDCPVMDEVCRASRNMDELFRAVTVLLALMQT